MAGIDAARRRYAELVREQGSIGSTRPFSPRLFVAFAEVPRERYFGKGPWKISRPSDPWTKIETPDHDPERLYDDVLVSLIADKALVNGVAERACAMAERTRFTAERSRSALRLRHRILHGNYRTCCRKQRSCHRDRALEQIARVPGRKALRHVSHVEVIAGDATTYDAGKVNAIYVNAGATHPMPLWLDSPTPGGRLIFPMVRYPRGGESWIVNARAGNRDFETGLGLMPRIQRTATSYATAVVRLRFSFHVLARLITNRRQIECRGSFTIRRSRSSELIAARTA